MFNWNLITILILISFPGIIVTTPGLVRSITRAIKPKLPAGKTLPSAPVLGIFLGLEVLILVSGFAMLGSLATPKVDLRAPFFEALASGGDAWLNATPQFLPMLIGGILGGLVLVAGYYLIFRPRLDSQTVQSMEGLRMEMGLPGRLLYGGILEEVLTRWGMMSVFAWLGMKLTGSASPGVLWAAIVISGVVFGLLHIPNYVIAGSRLSPTFAALMLFLNLWASLVFGWLFWQYGLLAAIGAHMLFHLIWYPFDVYHRQRHIDQPAVMLPT
ncbi:MAG: CPBP family intramembrane glutamic endopeptidase [Chloroflexota bacterium]|nr:CPBP family intramembrane glutamic endopeptidase [Chloroflexota bacterium]